MLSHLAESTAFAAAVWLLALVLRRHHARLRHALWMTASLKFLIPFSLFVALGSHAAAPPAKSIPAPQMRFVLADSTVAPLPFAPVPTRRFPILWLAWIAGSAAVLIRWRVRWRPAARTLREARPFDVGLPIPARLSDSTFEPAVFGIFRPVLVLPAGIESRLSASQLQAVIAHELCHVRHRDNLAAALHTLVEAAFWFHPLVWWIGARLVEERERACDEEVVRTGADRAVYAESILKICQFSLESPMACVCGISGADLKQRIREIVSGGARHPLSRGRKLILAALGAAALAIPLAIGLAHPSKIAAQTAAPLRFDVASVKASPETSFNPMPKRSGGRITWRSQLAHVFSYAYDLPWWRIDGEHGGWGTIYEFDATTDSAATEAQVRLMFQSLLVDRFKVAAHRETRERDGYVLSVAKGGPKLQEAREGVIPPMPDWALRGLKSPADLEGILLGGSENGLARLAGRRVPMVELAQRFSQILSMPVVDETGLHAKYYFELQYAVDISPDGAPAPDLFAAVRQLGLRLDKHREPVEFLVIDHLERVPAGNLP